jgi:hypothetical protein
LVKDFVGIFGKKFFWGGNSDFYEVVSDDRSNVGEFGKRGFHGENGGKF